MFRRRTPTDQSIIDDLLAGGLHRIRAEKSLYRKYIKLIRIGQRKHKVSEEEAQQAYNDAIFATIINIVKGSYRGESKLETYISRIFWRKCVDTIQKNQTIQVEWSNTFPEAEDDSLNFLRKAFAKEELVRVQQYMKKLSEKCQQMLAFVSLGHDATAIAKLLSYKDAHTASQQLYRCRKKLRQLVGY